MGASSSGTIDIALTIKPMVRVAGLQDISLNATQGSSASGLSPICVYSNTGSGYRIRAAGSGPAESFVLKADGDQVLYEVVLMDTLGRVPLTPGTPSNQRPGHARCAESQAHIEVNVPDTLAEPGTYTGTLTLLVTPD